MSAKHSDLGLVLAAAAGAGAGALLAVGLTTLAKRDVILVSRDHETGVDHELA